MNQNSWNRGVQQARDTFDLMVARLWLQTDEVRYQDIGKKKFDRKAKRIAVKMLFLVIIKSPFILSSKGQGYWHEMRNISERYLEIGK